MALKYYAGDRVIGTASDRNTLTTNNLLAGTSFLETDTNDIYHWDGDNWELVVGNSATETLSSKTLTTPTVSSTGFANANHAHAASNSGGQIATSALSGDVALGSQTSGNYVATITGGAGITSSAATSGEGTTHSLSVDAAQTQITDVGDLDEGSITSGFGNINIGDSTLTTTGAVSVGNLTVTGSTTTVNATTTTYVDPIITLQTVSGGGALTGDTNKDVGIAMQYYSGSAKTAFFGFDDTDAKLMFIPDATISSEVVSGNLGTIKANLQGDVTGNVSGNITGTAAAGTLTGNTLASGVTASSLTTVGTLLTLTVDDVLINGATIGHTGDTDLMTVASGVLTVAGNLLPSADDTHNIGSATAAWQDLFLEGDITLTDAGTIATSGGNLTLHAASGADVLIGEVGNTILYLDGGTNYVGVGTASAGNQLLRIGGTHTNTTANGVGMGLFPTITTLAGSASWSHARFNANVTTAAASDTYGVIATLWLNEPHITLGSGSSATVTSTLYIEDAASEGGSDYALFVDAGTSRFDGNIDLNSSGTIINVGNSASDWTNGQLTVKQTANNTSLAGIDVVSNAGVGASMRMHGSSQSGSLHGVNLASAGRFTANASGGIIIDNQADAAIYFADSGGINMTISSAGNVGIGTTAPAGELEVTKSAATGEVRLSTYSATDSHRSQLTFLKSGSNTLGTAAATADDEAIGGIRWKAVTNVPAVANVAGIFVYQDAALSGNARPPSRMTFDTTDTSDTIATRMTIASTGNVGIGTDAPLQALVVAAANAKLQLLDTASGVTGIYFADGTSGAASYQGYLSFEHASSVNRFKFGVGGTVLGYWSETGLGIGGVVPAELLHLKEQSGANAVIRFDDTDGAALAYVGVARTDDEIATGTGNTDLVIRSYPSGKTHFADATSINMTILGNGRVGIGTTSGINSKLTFVAATDAAGGILFGADTNLYRSAANTLKTDDGLNVAQGIGIDSASAGGQGLSMEKSTTGDYQIILRNTGTNAASNAMLDIQTAAAGGDPFIDYYTSATHWAVGVDNSDDDKFKFSNNATLGTNDRLTILTGGNVGIGTVSPSDKLHVEAGSLRVSNGANTFTEILKDAEIRFQHTSSSVNNAVMGQISASNRYFASGTRLAEIEFRNSATYEHGGADIALRTVQSDSSTTMTDRLHIANTGQVQIKKGLTVGSTLSGMAAASKFMVETSNATAISHRVAALRNDSSSSTLAGTGVGMAFDVGDANQGPSQVGHIYGYLLAETFDENHLYMAIRAGNTAPTTSNGHLIIKGNGHVSIGSKVGIGTTSFPAGGMLRVQGQAPTSAGHYPTHVYVDGAVSAVANNSDLSVMYMDGVTYSAASARSITNLDTLFIANAPTDGTNVTATNKYALRINAGNVALAASSGRVAIGTTPDGSAELQVRGASSYQLLLEDTTAYNVTDNGPTINLRAVYNGSGNLTDIARLTAAKSDNGNGTYDTHMGFWTKTNGNSNMIERMRILSTGNLDLKNNDLLNPGDNANSWTTGKLTVGNGHIENTATSTPRGLRLINSSTALAEGSMGTNDMWMYVKDDKIVFAYKDATDGNEYYLSANMGSGGGTTWTHSQTAP